MHILFITHFFPPSHNAGTENYTLGLARGFQSQGCHVDVVCAGEWQDGAMYWNGVVEEMYEGIRVRRINLNWARYKDPNRALYESPVVEDWADSFLDEIQPDVVHVTSTYTLGVGVLRAVHRKHIPLVLTLMDFWFLCPRTVLVRGDGSLCDGQTKAQDCLDCLLFSSNLYQRTLSIVPSTLNRALWNMISRKPFLARLRGARGFALDMGHRKELMQSILELPDVILSHSHVVQRIFAQAKLSERIRYLPNGHDLSWVSDDATITHSPRVRFGYMGQISEQKGLHLLIEAFRKLKAGNQASLDIWGDTRTNPAYSQRLEQLMDHSGAIRFRGRFSRPQLSNVLSEIDVLVVPSVWYENAPLVIQEAFAAKTPVIATDLGGMAEAITSGENGLLFCRLDSKNLAQQMQRFIDEPDLLLRLRKKIPKVKTIAEEVAELNQIYRALIN